MILHTVNKSAFERNALESCLGHAQPGSAVLMLEDGVYGAIKGSRLESTVAQAAQNIKLYVLGPDLAARGLSQEKLISGISIVDYGGFVDLAAESSAVQSWL
jgi:tRNA 2-thiouridine synthesizing protein B